MEVPTEIVAALISAVVTILIMVIIEGAIRPRQRKELRKQLLRVWISYLHCNLDALENDAAMERLAIDDRPLDRLSLHYRDLNLVDKMTSLRTQIGYFNRFIDFYEAMVAANAQFLFVPTTMGFNKDTATKNETDKVRQIKEHVQFLAGPYLSSKRKELLPLAKEVNALLEKALAREEDP